jgi:eukaryotic-like serine/threonine-protein kinase
MSQQKLESKNLLSEIAESCLQRLRNGDQPTFAELKEQYPELADELKELIETLELVERIGEHADFGGDRAAGSLNVPQVLGDYYLTREVGRGGMGIVYEAFQRTLGRRVALKVLSLTDGRESQHLLRFQREARAAARLHHTNIVPVFDVDSADGKHFYSMQFIDGQSLHHIWEELREIRDSESGTRDGDSPDIPATMEHSLARSLTTGPGNTAANPHSGKPPPLPGVLNGSVIDPIGQPLPDVADLQEHAVDSSVETILARVRVNQGSGSLSGNSMSSRRDYFDNLARISMQILDALEYAHRQQVIHRDIKPSNIILDVYGRAWLADFGLAKATTGGLTETGAVLGTLRYMSPERFEGRADARSDIYSAGLALYEFLTLRMAFEAGDHASLMHKLLHEPPPSPRSIDPSIPADLETIVLKAIEKDPRKRYQSAEAFGDDLRRFLERRPIAARRTSALGHLNRWCQRNPVISILTCALACMILISAIVGIRMAFVYRQQRNDIADTGRKLQGHLRQSEDLRQRADLAENDRSVQLAHSLLRQAQADRLSGRVGRRSRSLQALSEAAVIARERKMPAGDLTAIRNEAIACLALFDLRESRTLVGENSVGSHLLDSRFQIYTNRGSQPNELVVHRASDNSILYRLEGPGNFRCGEGVVSPDGHYLVLVYRNNSTQVWVWDLRTGDVAWKLEPGKFRQSLDINPECSQVALGMSDGTVRIFGLTGGTEIRKIETRLRPAQPRAIRYSPDSSRLAISSWSPAGIEIHDLNNPDAVTSLEPRIPIMAVAWRGDGQWLAAGGDNTKRGTHDSNVYVWDLCAPKQPIHVLSGHVAQVVNVEFDPLGDFLTSFDWVGVQRFWDCQTGEPLLQATEAATGSIAISSADEMAVASENGRSWLWKIDRGRVCRPIHAELNDGNSSRVDISPDNRLLVASSVDGIRIFDLQSNARWSQLVGTIPFRDCRFVRFHPDGKTLFVASEAGVQAWPVELDCASHRITIGSPTALMPQSTAGNVALSPDGSRLAAFVKNDLVAYDTRSLIDLYRLKNFPDGYLVIAPNNLEIATCGWRRKGVKVWEFVHGTIVKELGTCDNPTMSYSPDGSLLAVLGDDCGCQFWNTQSWTPDSKLVNSDKRFFRNCCFGGSGEIFAMPQTRDSLSLFDISNRAEIARLPTFAISSGPLTFSRDGSLLVAMGESGLIHVWDLNALRSGLREIGLDWKPEEPIDEVETPKPVALTLELVAGQSNEKGDQ